MKTVKDLLFKIAEEVEDFVKREAKKSSMREFVGIGADGSATKRIDQLAEEIVIDQVKKSNRPFNILSEEAGFLDFQAEKTLLLDPIDGTFNALNNIPYYSISLALGKNNSLAEVELGVVRNLVSGDLYWAEKGKGAYLNDQRITTRPVQLLSKMIFIVYTGEFMSATSYKIAQQVRRIRNLGCASLEMCLVASGNVDFYYFETIKPKRGLRIVDLAASSLIVREAGGEVYSSPRQQLEMAYDVSLRTNVMAVGDEKIWEKIPFFK
jgi:fructose-1,6-bisphosphatase/inositol monophosphatase family enzyme